jgi:ribosomal protein S18 acetylase RimI-like enzyme
MKIRKAKKNDIKECLALQKLEGDNYWKSRDFENCVRDKDVIFLVAEEDKKILGYVIGYISPTRKIEAALHSTMVHKRERGKKIGTKLVDAFCKEVFKKGVEEITAEIDKEHLPFYVKSCRFKKQRSWIEVKKER